MTNAASEATLTANRCSLLGVARNGSTGPQRGEVAKRNCHRTYEIVADRNERKPFHEPVPFCRLVSKWPCSGYHLQTSRKDNCKYQTGHVGRRSPRNTQVRVGKRDAISKIFIERAAGPDRSTPWRTGRVELTQAAG
jgi:hypothetical protein